jgi:hypothetical protein
MCPVSQNISEAPWFSMAITTKWGLLIAGMLALVTVFLVLWHLTMREWSYRYQESNALWRIQGFCKDADTGSPVAGAHVIASFREPISFKHHWRSPPPLQTTNAFTRTDATGHFEIKGIGGSVFIRAYAKEYLDPEPWESWSASARNQVRLVETNIVLVLIPKRP